jgi:hypothetical protein
MKATIVTKSPSGFIVTFETPLLDNRHVLLETLPRFEVELLEAGYEPVENPFEEMMVQSQPAPAAPVAGVALSFPVDSITATVSDGKAYWRVKGGEFQKWGVIVYEEVLAAAGLSEINPLKPYSEPGMVAWYVTKEDGKPKKVTKLERR